MTPQETATYLTDQELADLFNNLYDRFPSVRCDTCPEEAHCIGYHDEEWTSGGSR